MKRVSFFLIALIFIINLTGCKSEEEISTEENIPDTIEQNIVKDEVLDYAKLSVSELEVLSYENDPVAQYYLGVAYEYGKDSINQDFEKAMEWYTQSAAFDNADAYNALGYFYLNGCKVEKNLDTAESYFLQAIDFGSVNANVGLARVILAKASDEDIFALEIPVVESEEETEEETEDKNKEEIPSDDASEADASAESEEEEQEVEVDPYLEAVTLIKTAYGENDIDAIYYLGLCYEKGIGVDSDISRAVNMLNKAASANTSSIVNHFAVNSANVALGLIYVSDVLGEPDYETALEYFTVASDAGFAKGQYYCGQIYENALGVSKDYAKALEYYLMAAESDYAPALNQIGYLYYNGYGVDVDFSSAVYYQKLAALQGYAPAQINLGYLYENGYGIEQNLSTALSYYELAAEAGYEGALEAALRVRAQMNEEE